MCGRYGFIPNKDFVDKYGEVEPVVSVSPGMIMPIIINDNIEMMRWGLVPSWAKDPKIGSKLFNARAETIDIKPSFREAFANRRCLIPVSGFWEWDDNKKPHYFRLKDEEMFALAGLYETTNTYTIITTDPNETVKRVHDRMPVILRKEVENQWLEQGGKELLVPFEGVVEADSGSNR